LRQLSRRYRVKLTYSYEEYEDWLRSGKVDAVYIALPNNMHAEYSVRAANAGVHVLCEKPMAVTDQEAPDPEAGKAPAASSQT
jgi:predicted dehydrogenase